MLIGGYLCLANLLILVFGSSDMDSISFLVQ